MEKIDEGILYTTSANNIRKFLKKETGDSRISLTGSVIFSLLNDEITRRRKIVGTYTSNLGTSLSGFDLPAWQRKNYRSMLYPLSVSIDFSPFNVYKELKEFLISKGMKKEDLDENAMGLVMPVVFEDENLIEEIINVVLVSLSRLYHRLNEDHIAYIHVKNDLKEIIIPIDKEIGKYTSFTALEDALNEISTPTKKEYKDENPIFFIRKNIYINEYGAFESDKLSFLLKYISMIGSETYKKLEHYIKTPL